MIAIIDYGLGNIKAFFTVYSNLNIPVKIAKQSYDLKDAKKIILPGVGSFDYAMKQLEKSGMRQMLDELVLQGKIPVLGVCVGMQMLAYRSEEGKLDGLGWINAEVIKFDHQLFATHAYFPHMGWNNIRVLQESKLFKNLEKNQYFYFLHSYYMRCENNIDGIAEANYGIDFICAVNFGNIYGVQFHPEKSHQSGIQLLKNFAEL